MQATPPPAAASTRHTIKHVNIVQSPHQDVSSAEVELQLWSPHTQSVYLIMLSRYHGDV